MGMEMALQLIEDIQSVVGLWKYDVSSTLEIMFHPSRERGEIGDRRRYFPVLAK